RERARDLIGKDRWLLVHCDAPLELCRQRDPRGHYAQAERGEMPQLPGAGATFDRPESPDLHLNTADSSVDECVDLVVALLRDRGLIR
ncbi:MAG: adenylyl-sulfate kinase, partial [Planctomycetales bacterium]|nr:adenylyl-sulfate kinase [Planctomycetales bacterium]